MPITFTSSFNREVEVEPGVCCCWKNHSLGVAREVIGILEAWEKKFPDEQRILFPHIDTIMAACSRYGSKIPYKKSAVEKAMRFWRKLGVVTLNQGSDRMPWFQVLRHDDLCVREGNICRFIGWGNSDSAKTEVKKVIFHPRPAGYVGHWPGEDSGAGTEKGTEKNGLGYGEGTEKGTEKK